MRNLGFGAASAIGAWIAAATSLAVPFLISAVVISVSVLFVVFFLHEPHFKENKKKTPWFKAIGKLFAQPGFVLIILFFAVTFVAVRIGFWAFQPMLEHLQVELGYYGVLFGVMLGISLLSALRVGWVKKAVGGFWSVLALLISLCFLVLGAGAYLGGLAGLIIALLGFAIHSVAQGVYDPVMRREINSLSDGPVRASTMAVATMLGNIGFAIVAPVYGWSVESQGHGFTMLAIAFALCSIPSRRGEKARRSGEEKISCRGGLPRLQQHRSLSSPSSLRTHASLRCRLQREPPSGPAA